MHTLSKVNTRYGAPHGRVTRVPEHIKLGTRLYLNSITLDSGGYDSGGAYWGLRAPVQREIVFKDGSVALQQATPRIYRYYSTDGSMEGFIEALDRKDAKAQLLAAFPQIRFFK